MSPSRIIASVSVIAALGALLGAGPESLALAEDRELVAETHPACGDPGRYASCQSNLDETACTAAGGRWGRGGLSPQPFCQCPTGDAGCPCHQRSDCEGACLGPPGTHCQGAIVGTCSALRTVFGCYCELDAAGHPGLICVD